MPINCCGSIAKLTTNELRDLDYRVMRYAFDSQNELGRLADERIYQADLAARLQSAGMTVSREVEIQLLHREFRKPLFLDLVVEQAVYELKVVRAITDAHIGQLLTYLHLLDLPRGKLINLLLGGNEVVEAMLPISRNGMILGTQRFHLASPDTAFKITAMNRDTADYRSQLARLRQFSPLRAIHWINIAHHEVTFTTITEHR